ncbi:hypothetical protein SDC9_201042 [bioreactor metagenome]|uniref:Uncharacterized protein n=1 Tax=bioreactor metagenome TaxID=1076179 RepID=A0A645IPV1_9ZZZZ
MVGVSDDAVFRVDQTGMLGDRLYIDGQVFRGGYAVVIGDGTVHRADIFRHFGIALRAQDPHPHEVAGDAEVVFVK